MLTERFMGYPNHLDIYKNVKSRGALAIANLKILTDCKKKCPFSSGVIKKQKNFFSKSFFMVFLSFSTFCILRVRLL